MDIVRELMSFGVNNNQPTIRAGIAIGRILASQNRRAREDDVFFQMICRAVLATNNDRAIQDPILKGLEQYADHP